MEPGGGDDDSLLVAVKRALVQWGWHLIRTFEDGYGAFAVKAEYCGDTYYCVAKQYAHADLASFMQKVVRRADGQDALLVEFLGEQPRLGNAWVFDPEYVAANADDSRGLSKKDVDTDWYELNLEHGALLGDFLAGRDEPDRVAADADTRPTGLHHYS